MNYKIEISMKWEDADGGEQETNAECNLFETAHQKLFDMEKEIAGLEAKAELRAEQDEEAEKEE
jgi:hypothetical protein